jgi:uncharacterized protein YfaQ (DUF2300 family)
MEIGSHSFLAKPPRRSWDRYRTRHCPYRGAQPSSVGSRGTERFLLIQGTIAWARSGRRLEHRRRSNQHGPRLESRHTTSQ